MRHIKPCLFRLLTETSPSDIETMVLQEPSVPQRASLRIKGIASDGTSVADELRGGQIVLKDAKDTSIWGPFPRYQDAPEPKPREMPTGVSKVLYIIAWTAVPSSSISTLLCAVSKRAAQLVAACPALPRNPHHAHAYETHAHPKPAVILGA